MIMAGRGRRLTGEQESAKVVGLAAPSGVPNNLSSLIAAIKELNINGVNAVHLSKIQSAIKEMCTTKESMRKLLSDLHEKALCDAEFGEKLVLALVQVSDLEVDGTLLRNELLSFIQNDFKAKETTFQSDREKFINGVLLLGSVYNKIKVCGEPIVILGIALLEYFDLLLKGEEAELKTLAKQIIINGENLSKVNRYELLVYDLRKIITNEAFSSKSKCWILLSIDVISNNWKPLKGIIRNFYVANLGEEYKKLELLTPNEKSNQSMLPPNTAKNKGNTFENKNMTELNFNKTESPKQDLEKNFSEISLKQEKGKKERVKSPPMQFNKKETWKFSGNNRKNSGHDDRFDKEENFYGLQKPRQSKPENQRKNFNDGKVSRGFDISKTDSGHLAASQPISESQALGNK